MTQTFIQSRTELHRSMTRALRGRGLSTGTAQVTADGYLQDLERRPTLSLLGLGDITRLGPDRYRVRTGPTLPSRERYDLPVAAPGTPVAEPELQTLAQSYVRLGASEGHARNIANSLLNRRQGRRVD